MENCIQVVKRQDRNSVQIKHKGLRAKNTLIRAGVRAHPGLRKDK